MGVGAGNSGGVSGNDGIQNSNGTRIGVGPLGEGGQGENTVDVG